MSEFIISLKPHYLDLMLSGEKKAELRRRPMYIPDGSKVWIYGALPVGAIKAYAMVKRVLHMPPGKAWREHKAHIAISRKEYLAYVADSECVSVVVWDEIKWLGNDFSLSDLRRNDPRFHPPQFYSQFSPPAKLKKLRTKRRT